MSEWRKVQGPLSLSPNCLLQGDGFYISYNPNTSASGSLLGSFFAGDGDGEETALVDERGRGREFYILNGDFRSAYERLLPDGWNGCKQFFDQQKAHAESSWTTNPTFARQYGSDDDPT